MANIWDNATLKKLKGLVEHGLSTAEMGRRLGISKNAVVGKLNRLGWNSKAIAKNPNGSKVISIKKPTTQKNGSESSPKSSITKKAPTQKKKTTTQENAKIKKTQAVTSAKKETLKKAEKKQNIQNTVIKEPKEPKTSERGSNKILLMHQRIIQHSLEMAGLKPNQCRWPIGDPDSDNFHFCGATVFTGKPYCYEHCRQAYQFTPPKKK